jgi:hypothetical protein
MVKKETKIVRRRRRAGELSAPVAAMRNHCLECCGYLGVQVARCTAPQCHLWPYRFGYGKRSQAVVQEELESL